MLSRIRLFVWICLYFFSGISMTFYNKWLLSPKYHGFTYPITLILIHMLCNFLFSGIIIHTCLYKSVSIHPYYYRNITLKQFIVKFIPVGICFGLDIVSTNISIRYVTISLTEVIKSGIPTLLLCFDIFIKKSTQPNFINISVIVILCIGIALTSIGDLEFNWEGFIAAFIAMASGTTKLIFIELLLTEHDRHNNNNNSNSNTVNKNVGNNDNQSLTNNSNRLLNNHTNTLQHNYNDNTNIHNSSTNSIKSSDSSEIEMIADTIKNSNNIDQGELITTINNSNNNQHNKSNGFNLTVGTPHQRRSTSPSNNNNNNTMANISLNDTNDFDPETATDVIEDITTSTTLSTHKLHPLLSLFYFTPISSVLLTVAFFGFESNNLANSEFTSDANINSTIFFLLCGVGLSFTLNFSELIVIQNTSALTLCVLGVCKFLLVLAINSIVFQTNLTLLNEIGCSLAVCGVALYNFIKYRQMKKRNQAIIDNNSDNDTNTKDPQNFDDIQLHLTNNNNINSSRNSSHNTNNNNNGTNNTAKSPRLNQAKTTTIRGSNSAKLKYNRLSTDMNDDLQLMDDTNELNLINLNGSNGTNNNDEGELGFDTSHIK